MSHRHGIALLRPAIAAAISAMIVVSALAQEAEQVEATEDTADSAETTEIEEIVVIAPKPGSRRRVDEEYEDPARAKLLKEFYEMQELEEEYEWRKSAATDDSSRIKWGYDPRDEYRMRNNTALQDLSWEKNKPATVFKIEF